MNVKQAIGAVKFALAGIQQFCCQSSPPLVQMFPIAASWVQIHHFDLDTTTTPKMYEDRQSFQTLPSYNEAKKPST